MTDAEFLISDAKAVITSHERFASQADLEGVLSNVAESIVMLAPGAPLVEGRRDFSSFYSGMFQLGGPDFKHEYSGAVVVADQVFLHGVARGAITPSEGEVTAFANNFMFVPKTRRGTPQGVAGGLRTQWRMTAGPTLTRRERITGA